MFVRAGNLKYLWPVNGFSQRPVHKWCTKAYIILQNSRVLYKAMLSDHKSPTQSYLSFQIRPSFKSYKQTSFSKQQKLQRTLNIDEFIKCYWIWWILKGKQLFLIIPEITGEWSPPPQTPLPILFSFKRNASLYVYPWSIHSLTHSLTHFT